VVSPVGSSLRKLNMGAHTSTNLPLSNGIKIVSVVHRLRGEIGHTISDVQKRDGQTNKQRDKNSTFLTAPAAGEIRAPNKLGMAIENLEHVLAPLKLLGV